MEQLVRLLRRRFLLCQTNSKISDPLRKKMETNRKKVYMQCALMRNKRQESIYMQCAQCTMRPWPLTFPYAYPNDGLDLVFVDIAAFTPDHVLVDPQCSCPGLLSGREGCSCAGRVGGYSVRVVRL